MPTPAWPRAVDPPQAEVSATSTCQFTCLPGRRLHALRRMSDIRRNAARASAGQGLAPRESSRPVGQPKGDIDGLGRQPGPVLAHPDWQQCPRRHVAGAGSCPSAAEPGERRVIRTKSEHLVRHWDGSMRSSFGVMTVSPGCSKASSKASSAAPSGRSPSGLDPETPRSTNILSMVRPCIVA